MNYEQKSVDKMGQYEWGNGLKHWNIVKLSYKLCISSSDRGKCLLTWIIHCLCFISIFFFFLKTRKVHKSEKRLMLFYSSSHPRVNVVELKLYSDMCVIAVSLHPSSGHWPRLNGGWMVWIWHQMYDPAAFSVVWSDI